MIRLGFGVLTVLSPFLLPPGSVLSSLSLSHMLHSCLSPDERKGIQGERPAALVPEPPETPSCLLPRPQPPSIPAMHGRFALLPIAEGTGQPPVGNISALPWLFSPCSFSFVPHFRFLFCVELAFFFHIEKMTLPQEPKINRN